MARLELYRWPAWLLIGGVLAGCANLPASRGLPGVAERAALENAREGVTHLFADAKLALRGRGRRAALIGNRS